MSFDSFKNIIYSRFMCPINDCKHLAASANLLQEHIHSHFIATGHCPLCNAATVDLAAAEVHCASNDDHERCAVFFETYRSAHRKRFRYVIRRCELAAEVSRMTALTQVLTKTMWFDVATEKPAVETKLILAWHENAPVVLTRSGDNWSSSSDGCPIAFRYWVPITAPQSLQ
jgi:hypothetical protein